MVAAKLCPSDEVINWVYEVALIKAVEKPDGIGNYNNIAITAQKDIYEFWGYITAFSFNLLTNLSASILKNSSCLSLTYWLGKLLWSERCKESTADMRVRDSDVLVDGAL